MGRVALAIAVSACAHAAVLANAPLGPGMRELSLLSGAGPLRARLVALPVADLPELPAAEAQGRLEQPAAPAAPPAPSAPSTTPPGAMFSQAGPPVEGTTAGLPTAEIFYRGSEVDQRAEALNLVDVAYPDAALEAGLRGVVTLRLLIDHRGVLREVTVRSAEPPGVFEAAALEAARGLRFRPAFRNGVPVGSIKVIEVPFHPNCRRTGSCSG